MALASKTGNVIYLKQGEKGSRGPSLRGPQDWDEVPTEFAFKCGAEGEDFIDLVIKNGNYYQCIRSHSKSSSIVPGSSTTYWEAASQLNFVATNLFLAGYALIKNLGAAAIEMTDDDGNTVFLAKEGNVQCKTGTFENVSVSGMLNGVTGSFKSLNCIDNSGNVVCQMTFSQNGQMWFNNGDLYHQGTKNGRGLRLYASSIWCRSSFGAAQRTVLEVKGSYGYYYTKGVTETGVYVSFESGKDTSNNTYYTLEANGKTGDYAGFPVDIIAFRITSTTTYRYLLSLYNSQRVLLVNVNDNANNVQIYVSGSLVTMKGGETREAVYLRELQYPQEAESILGGGLFLCASHDNNW